MGLEETINILLYRGRLAETALHDPEGWAVRVNGKEYPVTVQPDRAGITFSATIVPEEKEVIRGSDFILLYRGEFRLRRDVPKFSAYGPIRNRKGELRGGDTVDLSYRLDFAAPVSV